MHQRHQIQQNMILQYNSDWQTKTNNNIIDNDDEEKEKNIDVEVVITVVVIESRQHKRR